jgi:hypothetical protein
MDLASKPEKCRGDRLTEGENYVGQAVEWTIYENDVPDFVAGELERLYESVYCTLARFAIYDEVRGASTYVAHVHGKIACLILFRLEGTTVKVINQQIRLSADDLLRFSHAIFQKYPSARTISLYAVDAEKGQFPFPLYRYEILEENILELPRTCDAYRISLSHNLFKRIQAGERKLKRDHPDFQFKVIVGADIGEQLLRQVVALADARMSAKHQQAYIRPEDIDKILRLLRVYGLFGVLSIDGKIRAGNVFYRVGSRYFMHVIAHDPEYDKYMLGNIVQYLSVRYCIEHGGRECLLMGGGRANKGRFRALPKYFDNVDIYRSRRDVLLHLRRVSAGVARHVLHVSRERLLALAGAETRVGRIAATCLTWARSVKQTRRAGAADDK